MHGWGGKAVRTHILALFSRINVQTKEAKKKKASRKFVTFHA